MRFASLRGKAISENIIFDADSPLNRDNCFSPYIALREKLLEIGVQLNTADLSEDRIEFELHQDVQDCSSCNIKYLLMFETSQIKPDNGKQACWGGYRKIFTWCDNLVDGDRFIKINFPNPFVIPDANGWGGRDIFCCLISANKSLNIRDERDLYTERVKAIKWFEQFAPADFHLYGIGWDIPVMPRGVAGKLLRHFFGLLATIVDLHPFPSYKGRILRKRDVLGRARYAICYENVRDLPGYITEKIFDCFFSGCVPVYWGASNVTDYIPADCFIDRRNFSDTSAIYKYLKSITESDFVGYQQRIAQFLVSDAAHPFGSEYFADTIANTIVKDLGI